MSGSAHPGRKRPKKHEEEEHENHERWLLSYADMVALLMCLFIVLFAMSQVDKAKFAALASGLSQSFGAPISVLPSSSPDSSVLDGLPGLPGAGEIPSATPPNETVEKAQVDAAAAAAAAERAKRVAAEAAGAY